MIVDKNQSFSIALDNFKNAGNVVVGGQLGTRGLDIKNTLLFVYLFVFSFSSLSLIRLLWTVSIPLIHPQ